MLEDIKARLKSPWLWVGAAGLIYNILTQHFQLQIQDDIYKTVIDIVSYIFLGVGVYSKHSDC